MGSGNESIDQRGREIRLDFDIFSSQSSSEAPAIAVKLLLFCSSIVSGGEYPLKWQHSAKV